MIRVVIVTIGSCAPEKIAPGLAAETELVFVGHTTAISDALELCISMHADIVLMNLCNSRIHGLRAVQAMRIGNPQVKVLVLARSEKAEYVQAMLRIGISGYLLHGVDNDDLALSLRTVFSGQVVYSSSITSALIQPFRDI